MADAYSRPDYWTDMLPQSWQHSINTNPILNALGRALNRRPADIEGASKRIFAQPGDREMDDRAWLLQQAQPQRRLNPLAAEMLDKGGLLANFLGPSVKLPGVPRAPGRYAMEYPGGRIDYKDMDGGVHVSGIYTNPEARGQGNAKQALQELIAAADAAKRPMSLEISPGAPGVDPARLRQWYESLGFSGPDYAMTRQPPPAGIRAYHGSPHDFDRFDISKIGTGEGAQAYGRGLYFAESEGVAKSYRDDLAGFDWRANIPKREVNGGDIRYAVEEALKQANGNPARARQILEQERKHWAGMGEDGYGAEAIKLFDEIAPTLAPKPKGRMYEVNIKADPDQFLDWDKPLSQQPEGVRKLLPDLKPDAAGRDVYEELATRLATPVPPEADRGWTSVVNTINDRVQNPQRATQALRDAGIPGIKYLDQGSRAKAFRVDLETSRGPYRVDDPATFSTEAQALDYLRAKEAEGFKAKLVDQGSRNFVVFDDALVEILRKYGLLPPVAAGTAAALNQQEPAQ